MIYIDYYAKGSRHFHKLEGSSFEIVELHIGNEDREYPNSGSVVTNIPIDFTIKTDLGEKKHFIIDVGYDDTHSSTDNYRYYHMNWFMIVTDKEKVCFESARTNKEQKWETNFDFDKEIKLYFENKILADTDYLKKTYLEYKKLQQIQEDFEV